MYASSLHVTPDEQARSTNVLLVDVFQYPFDSAVKPFALVGHEQKLREELVTRFEQASTDGKAHGGTDDRHMLVLSPEIPSLSVITGPNNAGKSRLLEKIVKYGRTTKPRIPGPASESLMIRTYTGAADPFRTVSELVDVTNHEADLDDSRGQNSSILGSTRREPDTDRLNFQEGPEKVKLLVLLKAGQVAIERCAGVFNDVFHRKLYILALDYGAELETMDSIGRSGSKQAGFWVSASARGAMNANGNAYTESLRPVSLTDDESRNSFTEQCFRLREVGKGMRNLLSLLIACIRAACHTHIDDRPILLGLDEPELGLHPPQAEYVGDVLATFARDHKFSTVLTSHSPALLSGAFRMTQSERHSVVCNLVRVTSGAQSGIRVLSSSDAGEVDRKTLGPHILSNVLQGLTHHFTVFAENENDALLYRAATDFYLQWMSWRRTGNADRRERILQEMGFGSTVASDLLLTGDAAERASSVSIRGEILFCSGFGWQGVNRYTAPLNCLGVRHMAWLDFDPVCEIVRDGLQAARKDPSSTSRYAFGEALTNWVSTVLRSVLKKQALLGVSTAVLDDIVRLTGHKNAVFNPFGQGEDLMHTRGAGKMHKGEGGVLSTSALLDTVSKLEELADQHDDEIVYTALRDQQNPWLMRLLVSVRWGLKCLLDGEQKNRQIWAAKIILPAVSTSEVVHSDGASCISNDNDNDNTVLNASRKELEAAEGSLAVPAGDTWVQQRSARIFQDSVAMAFKEVKRECNDAPLKLLLLDADIKLLSDSVAIQTARHSQNERQEESVTELDVGQSDVPANVIQVIMLVLNSKGSQQAQNVLAEDGGLSSVLQQIPKVTLNTINVEMRRELRVPPPQDLVTEHATARDSLLTTRGTILKSDGKFAAIERLAQKINRVLPPSLVSVACCFSQDDSGMLKSAFEESALELSLKELFEKWWKPGRQDKLTLVECRTAEEEFRTFVCDNALEQKTDWEHNDNDNGTFVKQSWLDHARKEMKALMEADKKALRRKFNACLLTLVNAVVKLPP